MKAAAFEKPSLQEPLKIFPKDEILVTDYNLMVRAGTDYRPGFVIGVTQLDARGVVKKPPVIFNEKEYPETYLQWMQYLFYKEAEGLFESAFNPSQACLEFKDFKKLLKEQDFYKDKNPTDLKGKIDWINQRLNVHSHFLTQLNTVVGPRVLKAINDFKSSYPKLQMPQEYVSARDTVIKKMKLHTAAFEVLKKMLGMSKQLTQNITRVRVNFSIVENVEASYPKLFGQLQQMIEAIRSFVKQYNGAGIEHKPQILDQLRNVLSIVKVLLMPNTWQKSCEYAVYKGHKEFKVQKEEDPLLNFLYHKHPSPDAYTEVMKKGDSDPERPFDVAIKLVSELRILTKSASNLLN